MPADSEMTLRKVGVVRSPITSRSEAPRQGRGRGLEAVIELEEEYLPAAEEIEAGSSIWVLTWLHQASRNILRAHPRGDESNPRRGVFSLRSPVRPNPIGLHLVDVTAVEGRRVTVRDLEALDQTPVLDIKPYVKNLDT